MSYRKSSENKRRLKMLGDKMSKGYFPSGVYYDEKKNRYIRYYRGNNWLKVHCRRMIRRKLKATETTYNKGQYKKLYDYWWELY